MTQKNLRNIAIIAHVDHGKTTLVDCLLKESGLVQSHQQLEERAMDSNDIEKERGITILAKVTSVPWKDTKVNIVDTPGHADFGGEVERILSMVDGAVLVVDAAEGPMPQTKFVLAKALRLGLKPILVINKVDKNDARVDWVLDQTFDLFVALNASEEQLDFPVLYASAKNGWASTTPEKEVEDVSCILDKVLEHVQEPEVTTTGKFSMLVTTLEADPFLGRILTGRVETGTVKVGDNIHALHADGTVIERARITKLLSFNGLKREPVEQVPAGDFVAIAGLTTATVADTICDTTQPVPLQAQPVDPPTLAMTFSINDSPLAGREGSKVTSRLLRDRLFREAEGNVAIKITQTENSDAYSVAGRGELQLGVLIENMRREGFELSVSRPRVVYKTGENGERLEPIEEVVFDVDDEYSGAVVEKISQRRGDMKEMLPSGGGKTRLVFHAPSRSLIGYLSEFLTDTRGTGIMNRTFYAYEPFRGAIPGRRVGTMISMEAGKAAGYALWKLEDRGPLFIDAGTEVYPGMILGEHNKGQDIEVNPIKGKQLTNVRASGTDENIQLTTPIKMSLEAALSYIADDELVEVTPESIRLRKFYLDPHERKRMARQAA
ncbi:MAG: translational GTPase TypA [Alphaproteobacteria bacterium]